MNLPSRETKAQEEVAGRLSQEDRRYLREIADVLPDDPGYDEARTFLRHIADSTETIPAWNSYSLASMFRSDETQMDRSEWQRNLVARVERAVESQAEPGEHMADTVKRLGLSVALVREELVDA